MCVVPEKIENDDESCLNFVCKQICFKLLHIPIELKPILVYIGQIVIILSGTTHKYVIDLCFETIVSIHFGVCLYLLQY